MANIAQHPVLQRVGHSERADDAHANRHLQTSSTSVTAEEKSDVQETEEVDQNSGCDVHEVLGRVRMRLHEFGAFVVGEEVPHE